MSWNEDRLHRWLATWPRARLLAGSPGHDAAVLRRLAGRAVVCTDQVVEGVHFEAGARHALVGRKAAGRVLSDLAATAARPRALLLALDAPERLSDRDVRALVTAVRDTAARHGAELVAGDSCASKGPLRLSVTGIGELTGTRRPVGRDRARPGQVVVVTGAVGGSLLGRHLRIRPRFDAGSALHASGATALMDVSDGLALDLFRIARASRVAIELDLSAVPIHADARRLARRSGRTALDHALHDGEDHELVATLSASALARARVRGLQVIGRVVAGSGLRLVDDRGRKRRWSLENGGWLHGR